MCLAITALYDQTASGCRYQLFLVTVRHLSRAHRNMSRDPFKADIAGDAAGFGSFDNWDFDYPFVRNASFFSQNASSPGFTASPSCGIEILILPVVSV
jgi:hypothetical protein